MCQSCSFVGYSQPFISESEFSVDSGVYGSKKLDNSVALSQDLIVEASSINTP